jgi:hypothetical protein
VARPSASATTSTSVVPASPSMRASRRVPGAYRAGVVTVAAPLPSNRNVADGPACRVVSSSAVRATATSHPWMS